MECWIAKGIPSYLMKDQQTGCSQGFHQNQLILITPIMGAPLCTGVQAEQTRCITTVLEEPTQRVSENEKVLQSAKCLPLAQHQTGKTPLGQVNRKLLVFLGTFSGALLARPSMKSSMCREGGYMDINVSTLDVEVLITPIKLERSN